MDDIPLFEIAWDGDDVKSVVDSVTRGSFWANGPYIGEFEQKLESYLGVDHAVVFNSGTSALSCALEAHGVRPGDEVIVPSFTFISTANAARIVGAEPRFVDIERERYGLDPEEVRDAINDDTAAIVPVHYSGAPCRIHEIQEIARDHGIPVIEDAAEAFGTKAKGEMAGSIGSSGMLSFCQNKVITTGEGGAIVTDDTELAHELELLRSHGRSSGEYFDSASSGDYVSLGYNFRMPDVAAALGVSQVEKVEDLIERRQTRAQWYIEQLSDVDSVRVPNEPDNGRHVYQLFTVTLHERVDRDRVIDLLAERGISSKVYFDPVHQSEYYTTHPANDSQLPVTEDVANRVLSLPMSADFSRETVERVSDAVVSAVERAQ